MCMCNTFRVNKHAKQTLTIKTIAIGTDEIYLAMLEVQKKMKRFARLTRMWTEVQIPKRAVQY